MQYRVLGNTGVRVSSICFGTMTFGREADKATSAAMFHKCRDAGVNFFDTANAYGTGLSEEILGSLIADCREELVIATKGFFRVGPGINDWGSTRRHLTRAVEDSLRRLGTDRVDVYFLHDFDRRTPIEETLRVLDDLVRAGKILYPAASNFAAWQVAKALGISALHDWARFACIQPMYNLLKRQAEVELLPMAESESVGVVPYNPLAGGLLTGKFGRGKAPADARLSTDERYQSRYTLDYRDDVLEAFNAFAAKHGVHPATLSVAWVANHPAVTSAIIGARSPDQLDATLAAGEFAMPPELRAEISALSPTPPPATDRSEAGRT